MREIPEKTGADAKPIFVHGSNVQELMTLKSEAEQECESDDGVEVVEVKKGVPGLDSADSDIEEIPPNNEISNIKGAVPKVEMVKSGVNKPPLDSSVRIIQGVFIALVKNGEDTVEEGEKKKPLSRTYVIKTQHNTTPC